MTSSRITHHASRITETAPRGSKSLPLHISAHHDGYRVMIRRGKVIFRAFTSDLAEALRLKERFEAAAGPMVYPATRRPAPVRTNTGIAGVSETMKWVHYRPRPCFRVRLGGATRPTAKCIYYGPRSRTRAEALRQAVALRRAITGAPSVC